MSIMDSLSESSEGRISDADTDRPKIVCLCGSTRFKDEFIQANRRETLDGKIVVGPGLFGHSGDLTPEMCERGHPVKEMLDTLHFRKIDISDEILVINVDGYIGESTFNEIAYARSIGKPIRYLDRPTREVGFDGASAWDYPIS